MLKKGDVYPVHMLKSDVNAAWINRFHPQTRWGVMHPMVGKKNSVDPRLF